MQNVTQTFTAKIGNEDVGLAIMNAFGGGPELKIVKTASYVSVNGDTAGKIGANGKLVPGTYIPCL